MPAAILAAASLVFSGLADASGPAFSFQMVHVTLPGWFGSSEPNDIAIADFDGKNGADIAVADFAGNIAVLLNNGHGGFAVQPEIHGSCSSGGIAGIAAGHFTSGGHEDILVACNDAINDGFARFQGNGDGTFKTPENAKPIQGYDGEDNQRHPVFVGNIIQNMVHGAFGGLPSVVWTEWIAGGGGGSFMLCNLPDKYFASDFGATECSIAVDNNGVVQSFLAFPPPLVLGRLSYATPKEFAFTQSPDSGLNSGSLLAATHTSSAPPPYSAGFSSLSLEPTHPITPAPYPMGAGDLNHDGTSEVIGANAGNTGEQVAVYNPTGPDSSGTILTADPRLYDTAPTLDGQYGAVVGDFNGDGHADVAVLGASNSNSNSYVEILAGDGQGNLGPA